MDDELTQKLLVVLGELKNRNPFIRKAWTPTQGFISKVVNPESREEMVSNYSNAMKDIADKAPAYFVDMLIKQAAWYASMWHERVPETFSQTMAKAREFYEQTALPEYYEKVSNFLREKGLRLPPKQQEILQRKMKIGMRIEIR